MDNVNDTYTNGQDTPPYSEFVDVFMINHSQSVGISYRETYLGMHGYVTMDLNITVLCAENYRGPACTYCVAGYNDSDCDINKCEGVNCSGNGQCMSVDNGTLCICDPGFFGEVCDTELNSSYCIGITCSGNSQCVDGVCQCIGEACDTGGKGI